MKVKPNPESKNRIEFRLLNQTSVIQLIMILLTLTVYAVFLSIQQFLFEFEDFRNKIIIINVLLCAGIGLEIGYFIWKIYKQKQKDKKAKNNS